MECATTPYPSDVGDLEIWNTSTAVSGWTARQAAEVEELGFDGITVNDSQCLSADPYVTMMAVVAATKHLRVATSATNPFTRNAAVTACAIASLHSESNGRAALGIGRGDSALAKLGYAPATVEVFEQYLERLQRYLSGQDVPIDDISSHGLEPPKLSGEMRGHASSRLEWLPSNLPKVEVMVAASGPRVIDVAARHADAVNLAVGVNPVRVRWGIDRAFSARLRAGLDLSPFRIGARVIVLPESDRNKAQMLVAKDVVTFARFSVLRGSAARPAAEEHEAIPNQFNQSGNDDGHSSRSVQELPFEFIDEYAIVGDSESCRARLQTLIDLGVRRFMVQTTVSGATQCEAHAYREVFAKEIMPALRLFQAASDSGRRPGQQRK
jgi:5,10-methylenetetrahydromethanopterin reductase